ncbi:MAG: hypothetical protein HOV81_39660 [Kofleriaceae bacterium]|nr:hypothetical protein [Kofleriaceae bacterium]
MAFSPACTTPGDDVEYSETTHEISVTGGCSTSVVRGLSIQIANEVDCMSPSSLVRLEQSAGVKFTSSAVLPYMHSTARTDLVKAGNSARVLVNSGYRTVAQQYLLYRWFREGRCGITAAALPGRSNHESGRAVDLQNWSSRVTTMRNHHWSHSVPGDPVHFDHLSSPDIRGRDVKAFQRLWNRNHPSDKISTDGVYGPQTAERLKRAPATGFAKGATCGAVHRVLEVVQVEGPDLVAPGARAHYALTITNNDVADWPAGTRIAIADGTANALYDADSWTSPTEVGTLVEAIPAGGQGVIDLDIVAPMVTERTAVSADLALIAGTTTVATIDLAVTVTPDGDADTSADVGDDLEDIGADDGLADEDGVMPSVEEGGCQSTRGGGAGLALVGLALLALRRRRR